MTIGRGRGSQQMPTRSIVLGIGDGGRDADDGGANHHAGHHITAVIPVVTPAILAHFAAYLSPRLPFFTLYLAITFLDLAPGAGTGLAAAQLTSRLTLFPGHFAGAFPRLLADLPAASQGNRLLKETDQGQRDREGSR